MSLTVRATGGGDFELTPEGIYIARCFRIIDLGTQTTEFNGESRSRQKIVISWELLDPETKMKDGRPFSISKRYTASLHEKAQLRKDLQAWRGKRFTDEELEGFDLKNVLGAYCQLQVVHEEGKNGATYDNVDAIMATREKPAGINPEVYFDISEPDLAVFDSLSDRLKEHIMSAPEWKGAKHVQPDTVLPVDDNEPINLDDVPFKD